MIKNSEKINIILIDIFLSKYSIALIILSVIISLMSCSYTRYLPEDTKLYDGSEVKIKSDEKISDRKNKERSLENLIRESPNTTILWMRPRLWIYNITGDNEDRRMKNWIKTKLGEPPVLFESIDTERTAQIMENRLQNSGFFDAEVIYQVGEKRKRAKVKYIAKVSKPYVINNIYYPSNQIPIEEEIRNSKEHSIIQEQDNYDLSTLKKERGRIEQYLRNRGYYFFNDDYLLFRVDSTIGNKKMDVYLSLKDNMPENARKQYNINNISIYIQHMIGEFSDITTDTVKFDDNIYYFDNKKMYDEDIIISSIFIEPGSIYRRQDHEITLNHLMSLQAFKFANIRYSETTANESPALDVNISITPVEQKSLSTELKATTKSNNLTGPGIMASFNNRNLFGGMENFSLRLESSFETTISSRHKPVSSTEIGFQSEMLLPKFLAPFDIKPHYSYTIPKTQILLSLNYLNRTDMMNLFSIRTQYGYKWNSNIATQHRFSPLVFNFFILGTLAPEFETELYQQDLYRRGLFDQYILGGEYSYIYNTQLLTDQPLNNWYFNINFDVAGNIAYLLFNQAIGSFAGERGVSDFGENFSQYFKTDFDTRYLYEGGNPDNKIAMRLLAGVALPYGNSDYLPYNRRFTIGGVNSIRAFHPRTLGPGSYLPSDTLQTDYSLYQSGEIKLLASVERRFDIIRYLKGAIFADAGNVWNSKEYDNTPGGKLKTHRLLEQIALGTGVGLRIDVNFFVLRFDLAFPLAKPYKTEQYFEKIEPFSSTWRKENLILNFAIGYPF